MDKQWIVRGTFRHKFVERIVTAQDRNAAIAAASKGRDFFAPSQCILRTDSENDKKRAIAACQ